LTEYGGRKTVYGFSGLVNGRIATAPPVEKLSLARLYNLF
jgi:hypothetical protein